ALTRLELDGLIVSQNGRKKVYALTVDEMREILDVKIELEGAVARWAAEKGNDKQRENLQHCIGEMKKLAQNRPESAGQREQYLDRWLELDRQLHATVFAMAGNRRAEEFIQKLNVQWHRLRVVAYTLEGRIVKSVGEHEGFVMPIIQQQPTEAEQAMRRHLQNLKQELTDTMRLFHYPQD
ncbi:MAG: GntR family transcriptional regulator, partial [Bacteroidota bacterium]